MKNRTKILVLMLVATLALLLLAACVDYNPTTDIPGIRDNAVIEAKHDRLNFALGMTIDDAEVISKCDCTLSDDRGNMVRVTKEHLVSGKVQYTRFDTTEVGKNKQVRITYKNSSYYITYDVDEYAVRFWQDDGVLYQTVKPQATFNSDMQLACGVNMEDFNFATDSRVVAQMPDKGLRFCGWADASGNIVTGTVALQPPQSGNTLVVDYYAQYLSEEEFAKFSLSYSSKGEKVFGGYLGNDNVCNIPESVTYSDFSVLLAVPCEKVVIPSTMALNLPLTSPVSLPAETVQKVTTFEVSENHPLYTSYLGGIYNKQLTKLYLYPSVNETVTFPDSLVEICSFAMCGSAVKQVTVPAATRVFGHYCFADSALETLVGWESVTSIMTGAFENTVFASAISIEEDGVLYYSLPQQDGTSILAVSSVKDKNIVNFVAKEGTAYIPGDAFADCTKLETADLGSALKSIGDSAFSGCKALKTVTFPTTTVSMGSAVFYDCTSLEKIVLPDTTYVTYLSTSEHTLPDSTFYNCSSLTDVTLSDETLTLGSYSFYSTAALTQVTLPNKLQSIKAYAFYFSGITSITLPETVESLGTGAFYRSKLSAADFSACQKLKKLPQSCFSYSNLVEFTIPSAVTDIPKQCFYACQKLKKIDLSSVVNVASQAFYYCSSLTDVVWGDSLKTIGDYAFARTKLGVVVLPDSVESILQYSFRNIPTLTEISFGTKISQIGNYRYNPQTQDFGDAQPAFYESVNLQKITVAEGNPYFKTIDGILYGTMLDGVKIGEGKLLYYVPSGYVLPESANGHLVIADGVEIVIPYSVYAQKNVTEVTFPEGVKVIGKGTFYNSPELATVSIPSTVEHIGANIFLSCPKISNFNIAEGNTHYSSDGHLICEGDTLTMVIGTIEKANIAAGTKAIASAVFMNRTDITEVVIPDSVTTIGEKAFQECTSITKITIGKGLATWDATAFCRLSSLETVQIDPANPNFKVVDNIVYSADGTKVLLVPAKHGMTTLSLASGVTEICDWAFAYNATLVTVVLPQGVKKVGDYAFYECRKIATLVFAPSTESVGDYAFSFKKPDESVQANEDLRYCDTLKTVMVYSDLTHIGNYAFHGQYGIEYLYFNVRNFSEVEAIIAGMGTNKGMLLYGCSNHSESGEAYYNVVKRCIYSETAPTIPIDGYSWWHYVNGEPTLWQN